MWILIKTVIQKYDLTTGESCHLKELLSTIFRLRHDLHAKDLHNQAEPTVNSLYIPREPPVTLQVILHTRQINLQLSHDAFTENICHRIVVISTPLRALCWAKYIYICDQKIYYVDIKELSSRNV